MRWAVGLALLLGPGIRAHRRGSPRRGIYRPDAHTVSRRGVATISLPAQDRHPASTQGHRPGAVTVPGRGPLRVAGAGWQRSRPPAVRSDSVRRLPEELYLCVSGALPAIAIAIAL